MDLMSIIGWVLGAIMIVFGIVYDTPKPDQVEAAVQFVKLEWFVDVPSILIVIGGTIAALMVSYPLKYFTKIPGHLKIILFPTKYNPQEYIAQLVDYSKEARANGLLSLQDKLEEAKDMFLKNSLMLVIDSVDAEKVKMLMETELDYLDERHSQDRAFYAKGSSYAPAFGMIGTLIGLVKLLRNMEDINAIASSMSVALITTFYGCILANLIFAPISNKLKVRHDEEYLCKMIVCEGVQAIQAGDNPRFIQEKLSQLLPGKLAAAVGEDGEDGGSKKAKKAKPPKEKKAKK